MLTKDILSKGKKHRRRGSRTAPPPSILGLIVSTQAMLQIFFIRPDPSDGVGATAGFGFRKKQSDLYPDLLGLI